MLPVPGRQVELARLGSACRAARGGTGSLVLITGEAGIGKSLLAQAGADEAASLGMAGARGWCMDDAAAPALWPWRRVARDVDGLAAAMDDVRRVDTGDGVLWRLVEAVSRVLAATVTGGGLTVVLEDLHWADCLSLDLLRRLLPEIETLPVLLVATARDDALDRSAFGRAVPDLLRAANTEHLPLSGLTAEAVATWLSADRRTSEWVPSTDDLVRRTGGNPFYIRSLIAELGRPGVDVPTALTERPAWRAVLLAPYRDLPGPVRRTVATAAVLAERLSPGLLADALDVPVQEVSDQLASAVSAGILSFGVTGLAFNHALVREAVVAGLGPAERARAHADVAGALERSGGRLMAGIAAAHWSEVEGPRAAARCRDLAEQAAAAQVLVPDRAVELARLALAAARRLGAGDAELAQRLLAVARYEWAAGMLAEALDSCASGLDLADAARRPDLMADLALVPQGIGSLGVAQTAAGMCRRALAVLPDDEVARRARLLGLCAVAAAEAAQPPPAGIGPAAGSSPDAMSSQALAAARACADEEAELEAIAARHFVISYPQAIAERSDLAARAVVLAGAATTTMGALWGHLWNADLAFQRGDVLGVQAVIAEVERVASRRSSPVARWHALRLRAAVAVLTGHFAEARASAAQARVLADRIGDISMIGMHHAFHVLLGVLRGDPADVLPDSLDVIAKAPPIPLVKAALPLIHSLDGDLGRARAEFTALREVPARFPLGPRWQGTLGQIGLVAVLLRDAEVARDCHRLLLPCARWCGGDGGGAPYAEGSVEFPLGRLAQAFGDLGLAAAHFERGIAVDDRVGARPSAALGRLGLAESVAPEDPARAVGLARAAAEEFERLDMPGPLARARALSERLVPPGPGRAGWPAGLTDRELEIARLVGQALTNQQIAERLFLSVRTVESHVRSVLAKLGLTTRTQIAVWLRDQG